jgi:hypothetical protein
MVLASLKGFVYFLCLIFYVDDLGLLLKLKIYLLDSIFKFGEHNKMFFGHLFFLTFEMIL